MKFYHIVNLIDNHGECDYKGLNIDKFIRGSQCYSPDCNECVIATEENEYAGHSDVTELTEDNYIIEKARIKSMYPQNIDYDKMVQDQQEQINELTIILGDALLNGGV